MRSRVIGTLTLALLCLSAPYTMAQESVKQEISVLGTGFFTKDSQDGGILDHSTDTGGFLVGYRFHINRWLAADANDGYARNSQRSFTLGAPTAVRSNVHQATGALVLTFPVNVARWRPYVLAGAGVLEYDPTGSFAGLVSGAGSQAKAAFVYGGGIDFAVWSHLALRAEYRGLLYNRPDFGLLGMSTNTLAHTAQPAAGIVFKF